MPKRPRKYGWMHDLSYQAELNWEGATVQFSGRALIEACRRNREAKLLVAEVLERAKARARQNRRNGEVR
jgi:hypothetical protein